MSRKKSEYEDKIEQLEAENEQLKATVNSLRRRLKKVDSKFNEDDFLEDDQIKKKYEYLKQYTCPECKKKTMEDVEITGRVFRKCTNCGKRTKAEKV
jgi:hypothetical protein